MERGDSLKKNIQVAMVAGIAVLFLSAVSFAAPFSLSGIDITIKDNNPGSRVVTPSEEDNEVEPGDQPGQKWDLEAMYLDNTTLTLIGGYNFVDGESGNGNLFASGDIFIDVDGPPNYGAMPPVTSGGYADVGNSFGYDYVIHFGRQSDGTTLDLGYKVYAIDSADTLLSVYYDSNWESNPLKYVSGGDEVATTGQTASFWAGLSDDQVGGYASLWENPYTPDQGTHYALGVDLSFLLPDEFSEFYVHYTYGCGNDSMMGLYEGGGTPYEPVPEPATMLLLGVGLAGMAGLGRRSLFRK